MSVVDRSFDRTLTREEHGSAFLAGGIMGHGYQCGMPWGAALAAGAQACHHLGPGPQAETVAITTSQRLVASFRDLTRGKVNCLDITGMDMSGDFRILPVLKYFLSGRAIRCFTLTGRYAQEAYCEIGTALSEAHVDGPSPPVSCAAVLARKMGASDEHATMAAGFAGGIGLSGGGCGALGAAIWITAMESEVEGRDRIDYRNPEALEVIDRFATSTGSTFECTEIVGRMFQTVDDHADYLRGGGCSEIIAALATGR